MLAKKKKSFNIIYVENKDVIPDIDNTDLLLFSIPFIDIQKRELNKKA